jgi:DNA-directed RNA polymerase specialized sigma24 family protein
MYEMFCIDECEARMYLPSNPMTDQAGYTLFRQAIVDRDADAWATICTRYQHLLMRWANHARASMAIDESSMDLADQAFARAWAALTPRCFGKFANLATLLAYLRACVTSVAIDCVRAQAARARMQGKLDEHLVATPEQIVLHEVECRELWRLVNRVVATAQERTILYECFVLDLPPRSILNRHPNLFANIGAVYAAKRNLLDRLRRSPELRQFDSNEKCEVF